MLIISRIKLTLSAAYELDFLISPDWGSIAELPSRIKSSISAYKYGDYWRYILNRSFINSCSCSLTVIAVHRQQQKQEPRKQWCLMMMAGILATYLFSCGLLRTQTDPKPSMPFESDERQ